MHILDKGENDYFQRIIIEKTHGYICGFASGAKGTKNFDKVFRDVYRFYGVSKEDIDNKTNRYKKLVKTLAMK